MAGQIHRRRNKINQTTERMNMKPKLLIVDDDYAVRESLRKLLEAQNYEVLPAKDAREALHHFSAQPVDLVVLDINLGADNGWKVFEQMTMTNPFVPTIVITGECGQRAQAVSLGVEGLIEKPIEVPVLLNMIREFLAESTETKLKRICGNSAYCRFVTGHYEPSLRFLQERYAAPFRITSPGPAMRPAPAGPPSLPTVIGIPANLFGRHAETDPEKHPAAADN